eukprot:1989511-Alexandrium_andersonii.AAC.1
MNPSCRRRRWRCSAATGAGGAWFRTGLGCHHSSSGTEAHRGRTARILGHRTGQLFRKNPAHRDFRVIRNTRL